MKPNRDTIQIAIGVVLLFFASAAVAIAEDESHRSKRWEILLGPQYTLAKNLGFDGGTTAKINDTWGFALQIGYNLAGIFSWSQPDYQAVVQPVQARRVGRARSAEAFR